MSEIKKNTVTVITLFYNAEKYFEKCLHSLFEQDFNDIEYIFINNCSTDNSLFILQHILKEYPHRQKQVKIHNNEKNMGFCYSMNKGIELATGEYTTFVDSDDWIDKEAISEYYKFAANNQYDIIHFNYYSFNMNNKKEKLIKSTQTGKSNIDYIKAILSRYKMIGTFWTMMYKTSFLKSSGIRMPLNNILWSDINFNIKLFTQTNHIGFLNKAFYHYRFYNASTSSALYSKDKEKLKNAILQKEANIRDIINYLQNKGLLEECMPELKLCIFNFKRSIIRLWDKKSAIIAVQTFPDFNSDIENTSGVRNIDKKLFQILVKGYISVFVFIYSIRIIAAKCIHLVLKK